MGGDFTYMDSEMWFNNIDKLIRYVKRFLFTFNLRSFFFFLSLFSLDKQVKHLFDYFENMTETYKTDNLLITMGEDFTYQDAEMWFKNLDRLIS